MERKHIGTTKNGIEVYDRKNSHFHPEGGLTLELLQEGLKKINLYRNFYKFEINFHRPIGYTTCVPTTEEDEIVMVYRKGRSGKTPMVKNRNALPCNYLTIILQKDSETRATLITSFIGAGSKPEPWDKKLRTPLAKAEAEEFWSTHALLYDESLIDHKRTSVT